MKTNLNEAKVGDPVWHVRQGWGVIKEIIPPVYVQFDNGVCEWFYLNGKQGKSGEHLLFSYKQKKENE
jgi:hypothetical protein